MVLALSPRILLWSSALIDENFDCGVSPVSTRILVGAFALCLTRILVVAFPLCLRRILVWAIARCR